MRRANKDLTSWRPNSIPCCWQARISCFFYAFYYCITMKGWEGGGELLRSTRDSWRPSTAQLEEIELLNLKLEVLVGKLQFRGTLWGVALNKSSLVHIVSFIVRYISKRIAQQIITLINQVQSLYMARWLKLPNWWPLIHYSNTKLEHLFA